MKKILPIYLLLFGLFLFGCSEKLDIQEDIVVSNENELTTPLASDVSEKEAKMVAGIFLNKTNKTKNATEREIKEVIFIKDSLQSPLLYIINYENNNGFVIVSATKEFYPIVAYSEEGNYYINTNSYSDLWLATMQCEIIYRMGDKDTVFMPSWSSYAETTANNYKTRSTPSYQNISWWRDETIYEIRETGLNPPGYSDAPSRGVLDGDYFHTLEQARGYFTDFEGFFDGIVDHLSNLGYNSDVAIFHVKEFYDLQLQDPLISTYWHQNYPYNSFCPNNSAVGCVPIAIGQIMNYHRWPSDYVAWSNIIGRYPYVEEAGLLAKIGAEIGMEYDEQQTYPKFWQPLDLSDLSQSKKFFRDHQYTVTKDSPKGKLHIISQSILNGNPVYMEGTKESFSFLGIHFPSFNAHAWVCDGYKRSLYSSVLAAVYLPKYPNEGDGTALGNNPYERDTRYFQYKEEQNGWSYFHMNWGWGKHSSYNSGYGEGKNNGWFLNADMSNTSGVDYSVFYRYVTAIPNK